MAMLPEGFEIAIKYICRARFLKSIDEGRLEATTSWVRDVIFIRNQCMPSRRTLDPRVVWLYRDVSMEDARSVEDAGSYSSYSETESTTVGPPSPPVLNELE